LSVIQDRLDLLTFPSDSPIFNVCSSLKAYQNGMGVNEQFGGGGDYARTLEGKCVRNKNGIRNGEHSRTCGASEVVDLKE